MRSKAGQAKVLGTAVCVGGAMMLTFYKGVALTHAPADVVRPEAGRVSGHTGAGGATGKWTIGTVALFGACFSWCSWFLLQSKVGKMYPALYSGTALAFFLSFLQSAALTVATGNGASLFAVRGEVAIISILFSVRTYNLSSLPITAIVDPCPFVNLRAVLGRVCPSRLRLSLVYIRAERRIYNLTGF